MKEEYEEERKERKAYRQKKENQRMEGKTPTPLGEPGIINKIPDLDMKIVRGDRLTTHTGWCHNRGNYRLYLKKQKKTIEQNFYQEIWAKKCQASSLINDPHCEV